MCPRRARAIANATALKDPMLLCAEQTECRTFLLVMRDVWAPTLRFLVSFRLVLAVQGSSICARKVQIPNTERQLRILKDYTSS